MMLTAEQKQIAIERTYSQLEANGVQAMSSNNGIHIHFKVGNLHFNIWPTTYKYQSVQGTTKVNYNNLDELLDAVQQQGDI